MKKHLALECPRCGGTTIPVGFINKAFVSEAIQSAVEQERAKLERIAEHRFKCAVEAERERCAKIAENGMAYSSGIEIAKAIRQTPTQEVRA